jgi:hypothetical protein
MNDPASTTEAPRPPLIQLDARAVECLRGGSSPITKTKHECLSRSRGLPGSRLSTTSMSKPAFTAATVLAPVTVLRRQGPSRAFHYCKVPPLMPQLINRRNDTLGRTRAYSSASSSSSSGGSGKSTASAATIAPVVAPVKAATTAEPAFSPKLQTSCAR